ncbi:MAG: MATE family efflux transporter [Longimicrobiales bacterium]|nr:MATE family efflux transporter [Longimicrobiales bacterium]
MTSPPPGRRFDRSIVEGPIRSAVWKLAWPTMIQNILGGLQGLVDHVMVGQYVGFTGNAAIGVAWQIWVVVIVFISSLFTGMGVLVARFAGADESEKVNRVVYQAFLTSAILVLGIMAPIGYFTAPWLLGLVNATPAVQAEALPYLRIMFVFSFGMLIFFMLGGALRSAGDARTPLRLGIVMTLMNITFNVILIRGLGPIPALGTTGAAIGTVLAAGIVATYAFVRLCEGRWVVAFHRGMRLLPDWAIIREIFRFGLPTGIQGVAMNIGGVFLLGFVGSLAVSAQAQAAYVVSYTQLFSFITWTSVGMMGATAAVAGQNLGARQPERASRAVHTAAGFGLLLAAGIGASFLLIPETLLAIFGMDERIVVDLSVELLRYLAVSGLFITVALAYTGGLQGTGDTRSPMFISIFSQLVVPLGICFSFQTFGTLEASHIWLAIVVGHFCRAALSVAVFRRERWRGIEVSIERARA